MKRALLVVFIVCAMFFFGNLQYVGALIQDSNDPGYIPSYELQKNKENFHKGIFFLCDADIDEISSLLNYSVVTDEAELTTVNNSYVVIPNNNWQLNKTSSEFLADLEKQLKNEK